MSVTLTVEPPAHVRKRMEKLHAAMEPKRPYRIGDLMELLGFDVQACSLDHGRGKYLPQGKRVREALDWLHIERRIEKSGQRRGTRYTRRA
jgi:hypothetical protein